MATTARPLATDLATNLATALATDLVTKFATHTATTAATATPKKTFLTVVLVFAMLLKKIMDTWKNKKNHAHRLFWP
jgi:hypothetical protein